MSLDDGLSLDDFEWLDEAGEPALSSWTEAVMASLFSDARNAMAPEGDRRGHWADGLPGAQPYGSALWTRLERGKMTSHVADDVRIAASQALAWLVREGYARTVVVEASASASARGRVDLQVRIERAGEPIEILLEAI